MTTRLFEVTDLQISALRKLRLYHWKQFLKMVRWAQGMENVGHPFDSEFTKNRAISYRNHATFHMQQVQVLNDFFPIGDTAGKRCFRKSKLLICFTL